MIDHIGLTVKDLSRSKKWYEKALKPLGYTIKYDYGDSAAGFGSDKDDDLWLKSGEPASKAVHLAFRVEERRLVDKFFDAAIAAGGIDNGAPGLRSHYHPSYYGAFVFDPDGNNIEAVCHKE